MSYRWVELDGRRVLVEAVSAGKLRVMPKDAEDEDEKDERKIARAPTKYKRYGPLDEAYGDRCHLEVHKGGRVHRYRVHGSHGHAVQVKKRIEKRADVKKVLIREAKAEGDVKSKYDEMAEDELRKTIAKFKAMGDKAPAGPLIRANQALARKLALAEANLCAVREGWDEALHPRGRGGKFVGKGMASPGLASNHDALHREWAELDRQMQPYAGNAEHPEAQRIINRQIDIMKELHTPGALSPGTAGPVRDVAIVGGGPAGLSAAIMGGAEGLDTVLVDASGHGGQAGLSSRIENVMGFPAGVSGKQLMEAGTQQARRLGTEMHLGKSVERLDFEPESQVKTLHLSDGTKVRAHTVIVAGGVDFNQVNFPGSDTSDVVYGSAQTLQNVADGRDVVIVGGANSAAQAALAAARTSSHVTILLRGDHKLSDRASHYLVGQVEGDPRIRVVNGEIARAQQNAAGHIESVTLKSGETIPCAAVGVFIGARPRADWVGDVERDPTGRVRVNPATMETNMPGVYAAGDVRTGGEGRVAAAMGDATTAVRLAHEFVTAATKPVQESEEQSGKTPSPPSKPSPVENPWEWWVEQVREYDRKEPYTDVDDPRDDDPKQRLYEALAESWAEWDAARNAGEFSKHVKAGPMPGSAMDSPGRGPNGKMRNFGAMSAEKLTETIKALELHGQDPDAHKAAMVAAVDKLGVKFDGPKVTIPAKLGDGGPRQLLLG